MIKIRSVLTAVIILGCIPLCTAGKGPKKVSQKEYAKLIVQCRAIRDRIIRENSFEPIRQQIIAENQAIMRGLEARFGYKPGTIISDQSQLQNILAAREAQHALLVIALIANAIDTYLKSVGTPSAMQLLADLIAGNQVL